MAQPEAVHIDFVAISVLILLQKEVRYAAEAKSCELLSIAVGLEDLAHLFNGKLVVIIILLQRAKLVQTAV